MSEDPAGLLEHAWELEPPLRLRERTAALDRLSELLAGGAVSDPPDGRNWELELIAERAIDAAAAERVTEALELADRVLAWAGAGAEIAIARATLARGRALAWSGTSEGSRAAEAALTEAAARFELLGHAEWRGFALFWRGYACCYENGRLREARTLLDQALEVLAHSSPRRAGVLGYYADIAIDLGEWDRAEAALDEAFALAEMNADAKARDYVNWSRAHMAACRGDSALAERLYHEIERDAGDWWSHYGAYFLCDAARTLDAAGQTAQAHVYLRKAVELLNDSEIGSGQDTEDFEALVQARAMIEARSGDPLAAIEQLQDLARRRWLEKRMVWRFTLLGAWARLRAGDRSQAATDAARGFEAAVATGAITVATASEPELSLALAPLAVEAGSQHALQLLVPPGGVAVWVFGDPVAIGADGVALELPPGKPAELVRMLAVAPHGLPVDVVLEAFFPETAPTTARSRLRQVLTRLRAAAGDIVLRDGELLKLAPAWVDARECLALARRARTSRGTRALVARHAALALAARGPLLVSDPYASWADDARDEVAGELARLGDAE